MCRTCLNAEARETAQAPLFDIDPPQPTPPQDLAALRRAVIQAKLAKLGQPTTQEE